MFIIMRGSILRYTKAEMSTHTGGKKCIYSVERDRTPMKYCVNIASEIQPCCILYISFLSARVFTYYIYEKKIRKINSKCCSGNVLYVPSLYVPTCVAFALFILNPVSAQLSSYTHGDTQKGLLTCCVFFPLVIVLRKGHAHTCECKNDKYLYYDTWMGETMKW